MTDTPQLKAAAAFMGDKSIFGEDQFFYFPRNGTNQALGLTPEKLIIPREYHSVIKMCYDYYQRGGLVSTVINRLAEFSVTPVRNGQRDTTDEANAYYESMLHDNPSRLMRFLRTMALEYFLSGMVLPKVEWEVVKGRDVHPDLIASKDYEFPTFDLWPPQLVDVTWAGWGKRQYWLRIPPDDIKLFSNGTKKKPTAAQVKEQQLKIQQWESEFPTFVDLIKAGNDRIEITDRTDPILRKEVSISQYPTPYLFAVLEPLTFKQKLRQMDFAVAARVINAILLVTEGDKDFPLTEDNSGNLNVLRDQIMARSGNPVLQERLFILFSNHTTKLEWITPDVAAMLDQDKYRQVNEELEDGLGFTKILTTGESRQAQASEVSTWAIQPMMEEFRDMAMEWASDLYQEAQKRNGFRKMPVPQFKPIKLQDFVKTAAVFAALFGEGNVSRTTRDDMAGIDFETEAELMKDEQKVAKGLPAYTPTPYSPPPPMIGQTGKPGRPIGSQNVPVNNRNSGVKPKGQKPLSKVKAAASANIELMPDEDVIELMTAVATSRGIKISPEELIDKD